MSVRLHVRTIRRHALALLRPLAWPVARVVPRRRGLWIFAYAQGYRDNPRYVFDHVVTTAPRGVEPLWLAQTREEADTVRATGRAAVWRRSPRAWVASLRAGVYVLGSGPGEVLRPLLGRAFVVQTWHGAPFKRIHGDFPGGDEVLPGDGAVARLVNGAARRAAMASRRRVALIPSQSELVSTRFQSAWGVGPDVCPVLGTPRADIIGARGPDAEREATAVRRQLLPAHLADVGTLVLYAPTWRDGRHEGFLADGLDVGALDEVLERHDAALVLRMHPYSDPAAFDAAGVRSAKRIAFGTGGSLDVNVLLRAVDCLVTDFSAISVDYALLGRPIVYFMPDLEEYESSRGLYESPTALTGGLHVGTWPDLLDALDRALRDPGDFAAAARSVADRYFAHRDTGSCARITDEVRRRVGLEAS